MKIVHHIKDLEQPSGQRIGFVPTMGAFHEGHLSLMRAAKEVSDVVVVSLFVNPTQFGKGEDFSKYPRNLERDAAMAESCGVDIVFAPTPEEMYPSACSTVHVPQVTDKWEGASRPGHFDGVATVVLKLFNIVRPDVAIFGLKDLQQCMVIEKMASDLNLGIELMFKETVREQDGLAMSSRNVYLSSEERSVAPLLHKTIADARDRIRMGESSAEVLQSGRGTLASAGFEPDYLAMVSLPDMNEQDEPGDRAAIIVAAKLGQTRLIDNVQF